MNKPVRSVVPTLIMTIALAILTPAQCLAAAGDLDSTFAHFGTNGRVPVDNMDAREMARLPSGKILAIGDSGGNLVVRRFSVNGDIDSFFGDNGLVSISLGSDRACRFYNRSCGIAVQQDGKFVVVAESRLVSKKDFAILRFLPNGDLDSTFGTGGLVQVNFSGHDDSPNDVAIQADGKIVVVGEVDVDSLTGISTGFGTIRLNPDGSLDTSFHNDGKAYVSFGSAAGFDEHYATAVAIQSDGKIVVAGMATDYATIRANDHTDFGFVRYNSDGSLDNSFSGDGKKRVGFGGDDKALNVAIKPDGKIVAVGYGDSFKKLAIAQLDSSGNGDVTFNSDGRVSEDLLPGKSELLIGLDIQPDGKIVTVGHAEANIVMLRIATNGSFDSSWHSNGYGYLEKGIGRSVIISPDGNYLVMYDHAILLINPDATIDASGTVVTDFSHGNDRAYGLTIQRDGKALIIGDSMQSTSELAVARYLANGSLDLAFADSGMKLTSHISHDAAGRSIATQQNGSIVVAGYGRHSGTLDFNFYVNRFKPDGTDDFDFSSDGKGRVFDFDGQYDYGAKVLIQADDKIVVVGSSIKGTVSDPNRFGIALLRLHPDGSLDTGFGNNGMVVTIVGPGPSARARNAIFQDDGKIIVTGTYNGDMLVMRYHSSGSLDTSFGINGIVLADRGGVSEGQSAGVQALSGLTDIGYGLGFIYQDHIAVGGLVDGSDFGILILDPNGKKCTVCGIVFAGPHYWRTLDFGYIESAYGFAVQDNGRMVLTGGESSGDTGVFAARFKRHPLFKGPGFELDTTFGNSGQITHQSKFRSSARANALFGFGIFVAGYRSNGHDDDFFLMKLENDSESGNLMNLIFANGFEDQ